MRLFGNELSVGIVAGWAFVACGIGSVLVPTQASATLYTEGYAPYGNTIAQPVPQVDANPYRFGSKYWDGEAGFYYYGFRFYSPELGRWLSRDSIEEEGGLNLYVFVHNTPIILVDTLGDSSWGDFWNSMKVIANALKDIKNCADKMQVANKEARDWWDGVQDSYTCCANGKSAELKDFPGVLSGDAGSTYGVLHCALGAAAKTHGVNEDCLNLANSLWETWEMYNPKYWEWMPSEAPPWWPSWVPWKEGKGVDGWIKDTVSDIKAVVEGYNGTGNKEDCIPKECSKK